jgi:hypothetical protein
VALETRAAAIPAGRSPPRLGPALVLSDGLLLCCLKVDGIISYLKS